MEDAVFKVLRAKKDYSAQDIHMLIVLCERLFKRNDELSLDLGKSLEQLDRLNKRVDFYRNVTMRGL